MEYYRDVKVIKQIGYEDMPGIREEIRKHLIQGQRYVDSLKDQPLDSACVEQLALERLEAIVGPIQSGLKVNNPFGNDNHIYTAVTNYLSVPENQASSCSQRAVAILPQLSPETKTSLARWQHQQNITQDLLHYDNLMKQLETATALELIVPMGACGAYAGSNASLDIQSIDLPNQVDWIIRAALNFVQKSWDNQRGVYIASCNAIWLGCANIKDVICYNDMSEYHTEQLQAMLKAAKPICESYPEASIIFNTRLVHFIDGKSSDMGHYETFFLHPAEDGFTLYHRDPQFIFNQDVKEYLGLKDAIRQTLREAGFAVQLAEQEIPRYNQNALSCGPSAVGEVMDYLIASEQQVDGFLGRLDGGRQRCYDDLSEVFFDAEGAPLTREVFMRLVQYYFVASQLEHEQLQHLLIMNVFGCFLRDKHRPDELYPIPPQLLRQYAERAYPSIFTADTMVPDFKENRTLGRAKTSSHSLQSASSVLSNPPFSGQEKANSYDLVGLSHGAQQSKHAPRFPSGSCFFPPNEGLASPVIEKHPHRLPSKDSASVKNDQNSIVRLPHIIFGVMTHPWTRYAMLLIFLATLVGFCIGISALSANPVALAIVHGMAMSTLSLSVTSGSVSFVSGALTISTFLSAPKACGEELEQTFEPHLGSSKMAL